MASYNQTLNEARVKLKAHCQQPIDKLIGPGQQTFRVDDPVYFDVGVFEGFGIILGKASDMPIDSYIVLLDNPTDSAKAIIVLSSCMVKF